MHKKSVAVRFDTFKPVLKIRSTALNRSPRSPMIEGDQPPIALNHFSPGRLIILLPQSISFVPPSDHREPILPFSLVNRRVELEPLLNRYRKIKKLTDYFNYDLSWSLQILMSQA